MSEVKRLAITLITPIESELEDKTYKYVVADMYPAQFGFAGNSFIGVFGINRDNVSAILELAEGVDWKLVFPEGKTLVLN